MKVKLALSMVAACLFASQAFSGDKPGRPGAEAFRKQLLEKFDADQDGTLNEEERTKAKAEFEKRRGEFAKKRGAAGRTREARPNREAGRERIREIVAKFDKDGDGRLSEQERAAAKEAMAGKFADQREQLMKKFDKDGNGTLDEGEKVALRKHFQETRGQGRPDRSATDRKRAPARPRVNRDELKKFDKDGDGSLNPEEKKAALDAIRAKKASE